MKKAFILGGKTEFPEKIRNFIPDTTFIDCANISIEIDSDSQIHYLHQGEILTFDQSSVIFFRNNQEEANISELKIVFSYSILQSPAQCINFPTQSLPAWEKHYQYIRFAHNTIPTPKTYLFTEQSFYFLEQSKQLEYPMVLKRSKGAKSLFVWKVNNKTEVREILSQYPNESCWILQKLIETNYDIRVLVVGDQVLGGIMRPIKKSFVQNNTVTFQPIELTEQEKSLALQVTKTLKLDYCGVDMIRDSDGKSYVIEGNVSPGVKRFSEVQDIDVYKLLHQYIQKK